MILVDLREEIHNEKRTLDCVFPYRSLDRYGTGNVHEAGCRQHQPRP
ncbi:hypothetical protein CHCC14527_1142 [Bacillus paralicheniformis]|nr:hypothetical protein CHCC14527_1142 [Bacillus paralicheniformis]